ncbi:MAG: hypothetical protein FJY43_08690 [Betaproteobacteria bacterium]|nr:hypothetical protein [Betaproteobacteria bacterium]
MTVSTTLQLPEALDTRIARVAKESGLSPHDMMVKAITHEVERAEHYGSHIKGAIAADKAIDTGADVYAAADVHGWLQRLARDAGADRPKPCRMNPFSSGDA